MLYSEYSKKMTRLAAVLNTVRRYKILIICAIAVILATVAALLGTRGLVYDSISCPDEVEYGSDFSYRAGAFLGDVDYEFCSAGSDEWTSERPIRAGKYYVRAVSERTFGAKSYGKVHEFTIVPKTTQISIADNVLFGEIPEYSAVLAYGDTFTVSRFEYADISKPVTKVRAKLDSIVVSDKDGNDVTSSYDFVSEYGEIKFTPREIEITVPGATGEYDGAPLCSSAWELSGGTLADGDGIVTVFDKSQTDAGSVENTPVINVKRAVLNGDGIDVSANYKITQKVGKLTVEKREILVNTLDGSHVYDDTPFSFARFELEDGYSPVGDDKLVAAVAQSITDVGEAENKILFEVHNAAGEDVTYNYSIVVSPGTLEVTKREVEIVTADAQKTYDGAPLENAGFRIDGALAAGHNLKITESTAITDAGTAFNALSGVVTGADGETDKTDNYELVWRYGTLTVLKRKLKVQTASAEWTYDGYAHSHAGNFTVLAYEQNSEDTGLANGQQLVAADSTVVTDVVRDESGEVSAVNNEVTFRITDGDNDYTANYDLELVFGKLKIKPREITVATATHEWMYDDATHSDNTVIVTDGELVQGHGLDATDNVVVKYVAFDDEGNVVGVKNEMKVGVTARGLSGNVSVTDNYDVTLDFGTLTVTKRPLVLIPYAERKMYDGDDYDKGGLHVLYGGNASGGEIIGGLIERHSVECGFKDLTAIDAGTYEIQVDVNTVVVYDSEDKEAANIVTANYDIACDVDTLVISKRQIYVASESAEFEYDGKAHSFKEFAIIAMPLFETVRPVKDHKLAVVSAPEFTDVLRGDDNEILSYENELVFTIVGGKPENYEIILYSKGRIIVQPRKITIATNSNSWVYDDEMHFDVGFSVTEGMVADGQYATTATASTIRYVMLNSDGDVVGKNNALNIDIKEKNGKPDSASLRSNYDIKYVYGTLTVTKRPIHATTASFSHEYDGQTYFRPMCTLDDDDIITSSPITPPDTEKPYYIGRSSSSEEEWTKVRDVMRDEAGNVIGTPNIVKLYVRDRSGNFGDPENGCASYNDNFDIKCTYGTLTITPRPVKVVIDEVTTRVFNGSEQFPHGVVDNIVEGQTGYAGFDIGGKYVGEYSITLKELTIKSGDIDMTGNYDITLSTEPAKLVITKRPITLKSYGTEDDDRYYDASDYWYYDGTAKSYKNCGWLSLSDDKGNLAEDYGLCFSNGGHGIALHQIVADEDSFADITDVGSKPNMFTAKIFENKDPLNGDFTPFKDISENYDISYEYGTIFVMPRPVTIKAGSAQKVYDDTPLVCNEYETVLSDKPKMLGIAAGQSLSLSFTPESTITDVGSVPNVIVGSSVKITGANGDDVTSNYDITLENGTLTVTKRDFTVITPDRSKVYDAKPLNTLGEHVTLDEGGDTGLIIGHSVYFGGRNSITCVPESGAQAWVNVIKVTDAHNRDVTFNYNILYEFGTLTVLPRPITVTTASNTWEYDGEQKHEFGYEITEGSLCEGHSSRWVTYYPLILEVGEQENKMDITIRTSSGHTDEHGHDYADNYAITYVYGTVSVTPRKITIETATDEWDYDGVAHFNNTYKIVSGSFVEGQRVELEDYAKITDPGTVDNVLTFAVYTDYANVPSVSGGERNVVKNYEITQVLGTLTVNPPDDPPTPPDPPDEPFAILRVRSEKTGALYMRSNGYGEYNGTTDWTASPEYSGQRINYNGNNYSVNYLTSIALRNAGLSAFTTEIEVLYPQFMSVLPYYTALEHGPAYASDIGYTGDAAEYSVKQYLYDVVGDNGATVSAADLGIYSAVEKAYREYVYDTYLAVPETTAEYMRGVISARKFRKDDPAVIAKVARYVRTAAKYNLAYDAALDDSGDVAVAFLDKYKEGVCRHYATSATLLYRTLGFPARYTVGALCDAEAGEWVEITSDKAHAWVEVYIDGAGWVNVEVTGGGFGGGGGSGDGGEDPPPTEKKEKIVIKPVDVVEEYTGSEIFAAQEVTDVTGGDVTLEQLVASGYTYKVSVSGSRTDIGETTSLITEFTLFDADGGDVSDKFDIDRRPGIVKVTKTQITVYMPTYSKAYDGTPLKFEELFEGEYGYYWLDLPRGVGNVLIDMELYGGITEPGEINGAELAGEFERLGAFTVLSESGADVTDNYTVVFASGGLTVLKREIRIVAGSSEKVYDGTPLTCDDFTIVLGSLVQGHTVTVVVKGEITDIGATVNKIVDFEIEDENNKKVTAFYSVSVADGKLTVK